MSENYTRYKPSMLCEQQIKFDLIKYLGYLTEKYTYYKLQTLRDVNINSSVLKRSANLFLKYKQLLCLQEGHIS